jgi:hypothetical protein
MGISLKPEHLKRCRDVAKLPLKYGRLDLVRHAGLDSVLVDEPPGSEPPIAPEASALVNDLEQMGPTFIKLGQLLSTREALQKIANRITVGLALAALIVGAAMLTNVPTTFRIWGYPGLATILFIAAAAAGVILVLNIVINDVKAKRKR